jgi:hypothetical protein
VNCRAFLAIALALASGSAEAVAQATTPPPPPATGAVRPSGSVGEIPPGGQWTWQETPYGGRYWAFVKPQDPRNFRHFGTPTGP